MDFLADARRRAFSFWLRTGRLPRWARGVAPERKYNPWHDDDGRFTFEGRGRYFGQGSGGGGRSLNAGMSKRPTEPFGGYGGGGRGFNGGGAGGGWDAPERKPASGSDQQRPGRQTSDHSLQATPSAPQRRARRAIDNPRNWRSVEANGYSYRIDALGRTRRVSGVLRENPAQRRSRSAQAQAGGTDRRNTDHGGHYIARQFNGPTEAFNHFAQDASFNRREYSALENQWARALRAGKKVEVAIEPVYGGSSGRPTMINVWFWTDGRPESLQFPNEGTEASHAKR